MNTESERPMEDPNAANNLQAASVPATRQDTANTPGPLSALEKETELRCYRALIKTKTTILRKTNANFPCYAEGPSGDLRGCRTSKLNSVVPRTRPPLKRK